MDARPGRAVYCVGDNRGAGILSAYFGPNLYSVNARPMSRINTKKLLQSKWTAVQARNREKHFLITAVRFDEAGHLQTCILEAVHSRRRFQLDWCELRDAGKWQIGWQ